MDTLYQFEHITENYLSEIFFWRVCFCLFAFFPFSFAFLCAFFFSQARGFPLLLAIFLLSVSNLGGSLLSVAR